MAHPFEVHRPLEHAYTRKAMLGIELLDAVTLERVTQGVEVTAKGLTGKPIPNYSGIFAWLQEDITKLEKLIVETKSLPFERVEVIAAQVVRPLHRVELQPLATYPFKPGITAIRGLLIESRTGTRKPVADATIQFEWLDDDDGVTFRPWQGPGCKTNKNGDFTTFLRLARAQQPRLDAQGNLTVRLSATRNGAQKQKTFPFPFGRVMEPIPDKDKDPIFAWDQL